MLRFASVLCFISVARAQKVPLSDNVDKCSSALCSDRNHRMTHHRGSFRWFNMPRWNPRCCLDCTWTHYLLCQTHAYLCGERAHTHLTPALVYDLLCVCVCVCVCVKEKVSCRKLWPVLHRACPLGCTGVVLMCFELWHLNLGLESHKLVGVDYCTLTGPAHRGGGGRRLGT